MKPFRLKAYLRLNEVELASPLLNFKVTYKSLNMKDYGDVNSIKVKAPDTTSAESMAIKALKAHGIYSVQILKVTQS